MEYFRPCVHDAGRIFTQTQALKFIAELMKHKTVSHALEVLSSYFIPHIGELNFKSKAFYFGYIYTSFYYRKNRIIQKFFHFLFLENLYIVGI